MAEPDEAVIARARADPSAFGELYERYIARIYDYVYHRTGSAPDAEDLTAKVFLQALTHLPNYRDIGLPFTAWLYRIAHNLVANWYRECSRRPLVPLEAIAPAEDDAARVEHQEEQWLLQRAIQSLSPERQYLLLLKYVEDLSNAEIGQIMGRTEGAIKSLLHRTIEALRLHLTSEELWPVGE